MPPSRRLHAHDPSWLNHCKAGVNHQFRVSEIQRRDHLQPSQPRLTPSTWHRGAFQFHLQRRKLSKTCKYRSNRHIPKPAPGFSALTRSRQSWLKNMYAERGRLGAFLSLALVLRSPRALGSPRVVFCRESQYLFKCRDIMRKQKSWGARMARKRIRRETTLTLVLGSLGICDE
jgi:hypothetical protein